MSAELEDYLNENPPGEEDNAYGNEDQYNNNEDNENDRYNNNDDEEQGGEEQQAQGYGEDEEGSARSHNNNNNNNNGGQEGYDNEEGINEEENEDSAAGVASAPTEGYNNAFEDSPENPAGHFLRNKKIIDAFFKGFSGEVQSYFKEFELKNTGNKDGAGKSDDDQEDDRNRQSSSGASITATDLPLVLRVSFYYDNITFHAAEGDSDELFNKPNSYKLILDSLQGYFAQRGEPFDTNSLRVSYNDFVEFSYYFVQTNPNLYLVHGGKDEDQSAAVSAANSILEQELRENIEKYERILENPSISSTEKAIAITTIETLKAQLAALIKQRQIGVEQSKRQQQLKQKSQGGQQSQSKKKLTREELRIKSLKEAFVFYSKQQNVSGSTFTFERIVHEQNVVNLACFLLLLKQYDILNTNKYVTKREIQIMFKKHALNYKELDFDSFKIMLEKVAIAYYTDVPDITNIEKVEKFYEFINLDKPNAFKEKRQLLNQPFNIQVLRQFICFFNYIFVKSGFRLLPFDQGREILLKKVDPITREKIKQRKEEKRTMNLFSAPTTEQFESIRGPRSQNMANRNNENRRSTPQLQMQSNLHLSNIPTGPTSYAASKKPKNVGGSSKLDVDKHNKVSWQQLEMLSFSDMKNLNNGLFKPTDLFNEDNDEEDKVYLAEYNLQEDRERKLQESIMNKRGQENYGSVKESIRPSLRYLQKQDPSYGKIGHISVGNIHRGHHHSIDEHPQSQPIGTQQKSQLLMVGPGSTKQLGINQAYLQRAHRVEEDQKRKERELMQNIIDNNNQKIQRGIHAANKGR